MDSAICAGPADSKHKRLWTSVGQWFFHRSVYWHRQVVSAIILPLIDYWHRFICRPCTVLITRSDSLINSSGSFSTFLSVCGVTSSVFQQGSTYVRNTSTVLLNISSYNLSTNLGLHCTYVMVCVATASCRGVRVCVHMCIHVCMCMCMHVGLYLCVHAMRMLRDEKPCIHKIIHDYYTHINFVIHCRSHKMHCVVTACWRLQYIQWSWP